MLLTEMGKDMEKSSQENETESSLPHSATRKKGKVQKKKDEEKVPMEEKVSVKLTMKEILPSRDANWESLGLPNPVQPDNGWVWKLLKSSYAWV